LRKGLTAEQLAKVITVAADKPGADAIRFNLSIFTATFSWFSSSQFAYIAKLWVQEGKITDFKLPILPEKATSVLKLKRMGLMRTFTQSSTQT